MALDTPLGLEVGPTPAPPLPAPPSPPARNAGPAAAMAASALPPQPRLASPRLDTAPPAVGDGAAPLPDRQLDYFLRLASARRARADTEGLAESSPEARLDDEALSLLVASEQTGSGSVSIDVLTGTGENLNADADAARADSESFGVEVHVAVAASADDFDTAGPEPLPPPPTLTTTSPALAEFSAIDTGAHPTAEVPSLLPSAALPLPAPPHHTPRPERLRPAASPASPTLRDVGGPGDHEVSLFGDMADVFEPVPTAGQAGADLAAPGLLQPLPPHLRVTRELPWAWWFAAAALAVGTLVLVLALVS
jgi:hypothetical protein